MSRLLEGKNALITGCNRGIGKAILKVFAENGAGIFACAREEKDGFTDYCRELSEKNNVEIQPVFFDITDKNAAKAVFKNIASEKKNIDILVNNAGVVPENRTFMMASDEELKRVFETNFFAVIDITRLAAKLMMRAKKGSIVNMSSVSIYQSELAYYEYVSSKAALAGVTKRLAIELAPFSIRVNALAPGLTDTAMASNMTEEWSATVKERILMKRFAAPEEIANAALFLASDLSSYMTGEIMRVDGGIQ